MEKKLDSDIEYVIDLVVGDYLESVLDNEKKENYLSFCRGLRKIGDILNINVERYDIEELLE